MRVWAALSGIETFMTEFRELWSGERWVAMNQQTMALLR
jgi:hypothetical protein